MPEAIGSIGAAIALFVVARLTGIEHGILANATPSNPQVSSPNVVIPILVAVLSGGGVTAMVNLFLFRQNKDSIIAQAAEDAVTAQSAVVTALREINKELNERVDVLEKQNREQARRIEDLE